MSFRLVSSDLSSKGSGKIESSMETLMETMTGLEQIAALERQYLLQTYNRYPVVLARGKGVFLFDNEGRKYLDFVSGIGVNALGHAHPRIVKAIRDQAAKLIHARGQEGTRVGGARFPGASGEVA